MNTFIFQSLPERYDLRSKLVVGKKDTWYATRYRNEMKIGDLVYFWMGGDDRFRGIYGWGTLISEPYKKNDWDSYGVDVQYLHKFSHPITSSFLKNDNDLRDLLIIRAPQATNFLVEDQQHKKLVKAIKSLDEQVPKQMMI
ncbi:EVE domain-containing protein [Flavihumibacter sp. R14]|nr:EVE domain-containing protein [Flavihumibacter soli]